MRTLIWQEMMTYVWEYENGELEVNTPVSIEKGFTSREDAITFAESWGFRDPRK